MSKNNSYLKSKLNLPVESNLFSTRSNKRFDSVNKKDLRNYDSLYEIGANETLVNNSLMSNLYNSTS
jgi:hypothetical protein